MKLTTTLVEEARYDGKSYLSKKGKKTWSKHLIRDDVVEGLALRVFPSQRKTFVLSYRDKGKKRTKTLGEYGSLTLDEARERATSLLEEVGGTLPRDAEIDVTPGGEVLTVADLTQAYLEQKLKSRGAGALAQQRLIRLHIIPVLGHVPLSQVRQADLWRLRTQLARRFPTDAARLSQLVRVMFKWAAEQGLWQAQTQVDLSEDTSQEAHAAPADAQPPGEPEEPEATLAAENGEPTPDAPADEDDADEIVDAPSYDDETDTESSSESR